MGLALIGLAGAGAPAAHGASEYQYPFTPELAFGTSSSRAGDHPALRLEMHKPLNTCDLPAPPYTAEHRCTSLYMQQNLKKIEIQLPPGFRVDAGADAYCDPYTAPGGWQQPDEVWLCRNEDARLGDIWISSQICDSWLTVLAAPSGCLQSPIDPTLPQGAFMRAPGVVYNDAPRRDEVRHLVVLWPKPQGAPSVGAAIKTDIGVVIRPSDGGIDLVADNFPDVLPLPGGVELPWQVTDLVLRLEGDASLSARHPLLTNPASCVPKTLGLVFHGYEQNSHLDFSQSGAIVAKEGTGELGPTASFSIPYQASECDPLPFDPAPSVSVDDRRLQQARAVSVALAQRRGEATAEQLELTFPPSFELNRASEAKQCSPAGVAARSCPAGSKVGEVDVELPEGQALSGHAYLTGFAEREAKLALLLDGEFDLRFDATVRAGEDGSAVLAFEGLPAVTRLTVNLAGGANGILGAPNACGPQTVLTKAESRLGQVKRDSNVVAAGDCPAGPPAARGEAPMTFAARLSEPRPGRLTDLDLRVVSREAPIVGVQYRLDGRLGWHVRKRRMLDRRRRATAGWVSIEDLGGARKARLKALPGGRANLFFRPNGRAGSKRDGAGHGLAPLWMQLSRASAPPRGEEVGRPRQPPGPRKSTLTFSGLPLKGVTAARLLLRGRSARSPLLLRNPPRCGRPLGFEAVVWVAGGQKRTLSQAVPLKGRGCALR